MRTSLYYVSSRLLVKCISVRGALLHHKVHIGLKMQNVTPSSSERRRQFSGLSRDEGMHHEDSVDLFDEENSPEESLLGVSTETDEERLKNLLTEIFSYRDSPVSNWVIETKVRLLCAEYKCLLQPHRAGLLTLLAQQFSVDREKIKDAAKTLLDSQGVDHRASVKGEERLRSLLNPSYHWLFMHMGRLEGGVKFLVDLRTDVLELVTESGDDQTLVADVQQLNTTLRDLLSLWFSVGFLRLERVTWQSPCDLLQKVSDYEAVHPVRGWNDLKRRVGPYRRCFMFTHDSMPREPIVVLHTALADTISSSMKGIVTAQQRLSVDASSAGGLAGLLLNSETESPDLVKAAIFYSISSTQRGLQGIELGNYLIKRVVTELRAEFPLVSMFSSLSPIPQFRMWLLDRLRAAERGEVGVSTIFTSVELEALQHHLGGSETPTASALRQLLNTNDWLMDHVLVQAMEEPLMRLCARYLYLEKRRGFALDNVANFHLRNGAVMWRLNWRADTSPRGLANSLGIMVNYRYFLEDAENHSRDYLQNQSITASEQVQKLADQAKLLLAS